MFSTVLDCLGFLWEDDEGQGLQQRGGATGGCPDQDEKDRRIMDLEVQIRNLEAERSTLQGQVEELTSQLHSLNTTGENEPDAPGALEVSDAAVRKRLMRMCQRKSDGKPSSKKS